MEHLGKAEREEAVRRIQQHFRSERSEDLGDLGAGFLLDFIERELAPAFYNQGVRDAKAQALQAFARLEEDLGALERLIPKSPPSREQAR
ncbi:MAG TPA: DUF2164 domain-containing protein [Candidatus Thermoplasmatota archaeon]|nr:DUF2164 domain-containing protein [Candidatus Thermoplasmatota archaeon]